MKIFFKKLWEGWKKIALIIGRFNTMLLLSIFYLLIISPMGLIFKIFGWDPLDSLSKKRKLKSNWKKFPHPNIDYESMKRQS